MAIPQAFHKSVLIRSSGVYTGFHRSRSWLRPQPWLCRSSSQIYCRSVLYISGRRRGYRRWRGTNENYSKWERTCLTEGTELLHLKQSRTTEVEDVLLYLGLVRACYCYFFLMLCLLLWVVGRWIEHRSKLRRWQIRGSMSVFCAQRKDNCFCGHIFCFHFLVFKSLEIPLSVQSGSRPQELFTVYQCNTNQT